MNWAEVGVQASFEAVDLADQAQATWDYEEL